MSSKVLRWMAVVTLTFVLGGHWAILQSVAWTTMVAGYAQAGSIKEALTETFDGRHPCPICNFVARGKKSEQKQEKQKLLVKLDVFLVPSQARLYPPPRESLQYAAPRLKLVRRESPPTPPPRLLRG